MSRSSQRRRIVSILAIVWLLATVAACEFAAWRFQKRVPPVGAPGAVQGGIIMAPSPYQAAPAPVYSAPPGAVPAAPVPAAPVPAAPVPAAPVPAAPVPAAPVPAAPAAPVPPAPAAPVPPAPAASVPTAASEVRYSIDAQTGHPQGAVAIFQATPVPASVFQPAPKTAPRFPASKRGQTLPSPYYLEDDVQYFSAAQPAPVAPAPLSAPQSPLLVGIALLFLMTGLGPLSVLCCFFSRGPTRGFWLGAQFGAAPCFVTGYVCVFFVALVAYTNQVDPNNGTPVPSLIADMAEYIIKSRLVVMPTIALSSGLFLGLAVYAVQAPGPQQSLRAFRASRNRKLVLLVGYSITWLVGMTWHPNGVWVLMPIALFAIPSFALAGVICGRGQLRAICLGASAFWLAAPLSIYYVCSLWIASVEYGPSELGAGAIAFQLVLLSTGISFAFCGVLYRLLRTNRRRHRRLHGEAACCSGFTGGCCCNDECGCECIA